MQTFLDDIADELLKSGSNDFSDFCIVLPNRRAGVFLRDSIAKKSSKAIWAPEIISIEDFLFNLSPFIKADQSTLLFAFYEIYEKRAKDPQTIELFANWAPVYLSDINELDLNLLDAQDVFAQLHSIERIKKWNPTTGEETEFQKRHLHFVEQFFPFYQELRDFLTSKKIGYQGMAFRHVAENIETIINSSTWKEVWFAGFNALTVSEERILEEWKNSGKAKLFWDMDEFYVNDPIHEAGHYARNYLSGQADLKLDRGFSWLSNRLSSEPKDVSLIPAQRSVVQARIAGSILQEKLSAGADVLTNTAVILNDEQLLLPLLGSLPTALQGVNITMGYGLENSQSAVFIENIFSLYVRTVNGAGFHHNLVDRIESDPFFQLLIGDSVSVERSNRFYYSPDDLSQTALHKQIFDYSWCNVTGFLDNLKNLIPKLGKLLPTHSIELEFLFLLEKLNQRLLDLTEEFGTIDSVKTLHTFWRQLLRNQQLDFVGEPLTGLQIMGMLETRNLDFEEVIILGVNEGNLPSTTHANSYFTFDIRRGYGLACQNERDAVTAYHFYRLLQRAKKVTLIYDQDTDSFGGGEVSRYVKQLQLEKSDNISITEKLVEQVIPESVVPPEISIQKGDFEIEKLKQLAASGLSPSALNTFRSCSLKYYFRYVAGVKEPDKFEEEMDSAKLGSAIHDTLEELYTPWIGGFLNSDDLKVSKKRVEKLLQGNFGKQLKTGEEITGQDVLAFEVAKTYVNRVIDHDLATLKSGKTIEILGLEDTLEKTYGFGGGQHQVKLKGKADRIDRIDQQTVRIIDYKTGSFQKDFNIRDVSMFESSKSDNAFQLLFYRLISPYGSNHEVEPTGFYLRSNQIERNIKVSQDKKAVAGTELDGYVEELLDSTVSELLDQTIPFTQTEDLSRCKHCDYNGVCQRATKDT